MESAFSIRQLGSDDVEIYADLLQSHQTTWTHPPDEAAHLTRSRDLLASKDLYVFGVIDSDSRVLMSISARTWVRQPVYSIAAFKTRQTLSIVDFKLMFRPLFERLLREMESQERREFWYVIEDKKIYHKRKDRGGRNFLQYMTSALESYVVFNECYIEAGQLPKWLLHAEILGGAQPVASVIRRAVYRKKIEST